MKMISKHFFIGVISFILLFPFQVKAEQVTVKYKIINHITKMEMFPAGDEKGHVVGVVQRGGLAMFENGDVANQTAVVVFDAMVGKGGKYDNYSTLTFPDGSTWVIKSTGGSMERTPDQKRLLTKQTAEFLKGTGKYEGIKGTINIIGIQYGPSEVGKGDWIADCTGNYTLPKK